MGNLTKEEYEGLKMFLTAKERFDKYPMNTRVGTFAKLISAGASVELSNEVDGMFKANMTGDLSLIGTLLMSIAAAIARSPDPEALLQCSDTGLRYLVAGMRKDIQDAIDLAERTNANV